MKLDIVCVLTIRLAIGSISIPQILLCQFEFHLYMTAKAKYKERL